MPSLSRKRLLFPLLGLGAAITVGWILSFHYVSFNQVKTITLDTMQWAHAHPVAVAGVLFVVHAIGMLLSLPTKGIFNVVAGALLGFVAGFAVTLAGVLAGATGLFFISRKLLRTRAQEQLDGRLARFQKRLTGRPVLTIAGLRLVLTLPYGPITIMAALTPMKYRHFLLGSLLGDIPVVALYAAAGLKLAELSRTSEAIPWTTVALLSAAGVALVVGALFGQKKQDVQQ